MRRKAGPRKKRLSQQDLREMGCTPGRLLTRYSPDGRRATVRQLAPESVMVRPNAAIFKSRLTNNSQDTQANEGSAA